MVFGLARSTLQWLVASLNLFIFQSIRRNNMTQYDKGAVKRYRQV